MPRSKLDRLAPADSRARREAATPSTIRRRRARRSKSALRLCSALSAHPTVADGAVPLILAITSPAGSADPDHARTCPAFGPAAGARSPRKCAAAIRSTRGRTIPLGLLRRCARSQGLQRRNLDSPAALCHRAVHDHRTHFENFDRTTQSGRRTPAAGCSNSSAAAASRRSADRLERLRRHQARRSG